MGTFCIFVICILLLSGCYGRDIRNYLPLKCDPYRDEKPTAFVPSKWVSDEPYIWFNVTASNNADGQATVNDKVINIRVEFSDSRSFFAFDSKENEMILEGACEFYDDKFIVEIDEKWDLLYNFKYPKITFYKCAIDDETSA